MEHSNSDSERTSNKRHVKMWVTDAIAMPNVHKMALSTTNRDIYFYDMSTPIYTPQFRLCGECFIILKVVCSLYYFQNALFEIICGIIKYQGVVYVQCEVNFKILLETFIFYYFICVYSSTCIASTCSMVFP